MLRFCIAPHKKRTMGQPIVRFRILEEKAHDLLHNKHRSTACQSNDDQTFIFKRQQHAHQQTRSTTDNVVGSIQDRREGHRCQAGRRNIPQEGSQETAANRLLQQSQGDRPNEVGGDRHHQHINVNTHWATSSSTGQTKAQIAAAATVQMTMAKPADSSFSPGTQVNRQLNTSASTTLRRIGFSFRA